jgi:hypothetical protein
LKSQCDKQVSAPVVGSLHDGVLDLRFEPSGQPVKPFTLTPGSLEPMSLANLGDGYRCHTPLRNYWLKASMLTLRSCARRADVFVSANFLHLVPALDNRYLTSKKPYFPPVDDSEEVRALESEQLAGGPLTKNYSDRNEQHVA